jgi:chemotaxis protein CheD
VRPLVAANIGSERIAVRMAEHVASVDDDVLVALGLGSCIGCAIVEAGGGAAGLAHVVLPDSSAARGHAPPGKYADTAVPRLLDELVRLGARRERLRAVICGGAHMFSLDAGGRGALLDIGARNTAEVERRLSEAGIPLRASAVGGASGRSMEVHVRSGRVLVRTVGQEAIAL